MEQVFLNQPCNEEQVSEEDIATNCCDKESEDRTCYPSECVLDNWKHGKEKTNESNEEFRQGYSTFQLFSSCS